MNSRTDAIAAIESFFQSNNRILLLSGTHQNEKHKLLLSCLGTTAKPISILFRANAQQNVGLFLSLSGRGSIPKSGAQVGALRIYADTINSRSWKASPGKVDIAIVYPVDSLNPKTGPECVEDLLVRADRVCLATWTDNKDFGWIEAYHPIKAVYDAEEERPEYHERMTEIISKKREESISGLPEYAKSTLTSLLIQFHCDTCGCTRWGKLNKPFPGLPMLRNAEMGEFEAACLMCGNQVSDNYNWWR
jgi:hypothetical protein